MSTAPSGRSYRGRSRTQGGEREAPNDCVDTPAWLADLMVEWAGVTPDDRVLEPCFGNGGILHALRGVVCRLVLGVEVEPPKPPVLGSIRDGWQSRFTAVNNDFFEVKPGHMLITGDVTGYMDVVLVNPPFSKLGAQRFTDHILTHWLNPGGRLITVMPAYVLDNSESRKRDWWSKINIHRMGLLPLNTFKASGVPRFDGWLMDIRLYPRDGGPRFEFVHKPEGV